MGHIRAFSMLSPTMRSETTSSPILFKKSIEDLRHQSTARAIKQITRHNTRRPSEDKWDESSTKAPLFQPPMTQRQTGIAFPQAEEYRNLVRSSSSSISERISEKFDEGSVVPENMPGQRTPEAESEPSIVKMIASMKQPSLRQTTRSPAPLQNDLMEKHALVQRPTPPVDPQLNNLEQGQEPELGFGPPTAELSCSSSSEEFTSSFVSSTGEPIEDFPTRRITIQQPTYKTTLSDQVQPMEDSSSLLSGKASIIDTETEPSEPSLLPLVVSRTTDVPSRIYSFAPVVQTYRTMSKTDQPVLSRQTTLAKQSTTTESPPSCPSTPGSIVEHRELPEDTTRPSNTGFEDFKSASPIEELSQLATSVAPASESQSAIIPTPPLSRRLTRRSISKQYRHTSNGIVFDSARRSIALSDAGNNEILQSPISRTVTNELASLSRKSTSRFPKQRTQSLEGPEMISLPPSRQVTEQLMPTQVRLLPLSRQTTRQFRDSSAFGSPEHELPEVMQCTGEQSFEEEEAPIEQGALGRLSTLPGLRESSTSPREPQEVEITPETTEPLDVELLDMLSRSPTVNEISMISRQSTEPLQCNEVQSLIDYMGTAGLSRLPTHQPTHQRTGFSRRTTRRGSILSSRASNLSSLSEELSAGDVPPLAMRLSTRRPTRISRRSSVEELSHELAAAPMDDQQRTDSTSSRECFTAVKKATTVSRRASRIPTPSPVPSESKSASVSQRALSRNDTCLPISNVNVPVREWKQDLDIKPDLDVDSATDSRGRTNSARASRLDEPLAALDIYNASPKSTYGSDVVMPTGHPIAREYERLPSFANPNFMETTQQMVEEDTAMSVGTIPEEELGHRDMASTEDHQETPFDRKVDGRVPSIMAIPQSLPERPRGLSVAPGIEVLPPDLVQGPLPPLEKHTRPRKKMINYPPDQQHPVAPAYPLRDTPSWTRPDFHTPQPKLKVEPKRKKRGLLHWSAKPKQHLQPAARPYPEPETYRAHAHKHDRHGPREPVSVYPKVMLPETRFEPSSRGQQHSHKYADPFRSTPNQQEAMPGAHLRASGRSKASQRTLPSQIPETVRHQPEARQIPSNEKKVPDLLQAQAPRGGPQTDEKPYRSRPSQKLEDFPRHVRKDVRSEPETTGPRLFSEGEEEMKGYTTSDTSFPNIGDVFTRFLGDGKGTRMCVKITSQPPTIEIRVPLRKTRVMSDIS
jgi:hypothetical protein